MKPLEIREKYKTIFEQGKSAQEYGLSVKTEKSAQGQLSSRSFSLHGRDLCEAHSLVVLWAEQVSCTPGFGRPG